MSVFEDHAEKARAVLGNRICTALLSNGYKTAVYAPTAEEAAKLALDLIPTGASIGVPGTVTVRQLGLMEQFAAKGCAVYHHWDPALTPEMRPDRMVQENSADWCVTSSNAITHDGKMVNIDGTGNRVACMSWSKGKILYIVGMNKVAPDVESAIARARNCGTPANAFRLNATPPCTKTGHCIDCNAPDRMCRVLTIMERAPFGREAHAILVGENLGY